MTKKKGEPSTEPTSEPIASIIDQGNSFFGGPVVELLLKQFGKQIGEIIIGWLLNRGQGARNEFLGLDTKAAQNLLTDILVQNREEILDLIRRQSAVAFDAGIAAIRAA